MRENESVLLVLSVCDGKIILEKGEILYEKCQKQVLVQEIGKIYIKQGVVGFPLSTPAKIDLAKP